MWRWNRPRQRWLVAAVVALAVSGGAVSYLLSPDSDVAPITGLRQLDLLYPRISSRRRSSSHSHCSCSPSLDTPWPQQDQGGNGLHGEVGGRDLVAVDAIPGELPGPALREVFQPGFQRTTGCTRLLPEIEPHQPGFAHSGGDLRLLKDREGRHGLLHSTVGWRVAGLVGTRPHDRAATAWSWPARARARRRCRGPADVPHC